MELDGTPRSKATTSPGPSSLLGPHRRSSAISQEVPPPTVSSTSKTSAVGLEIASPESHGEKMAEPGPTKRPQKWAIPPWCPLQTGGGPAHPHKRQNMLFAVGPNKTRYGGSTQLPHALLHSSAKSNAYPEIKVCAWWDSIPKYAGIIQFRDHKNARKPHLLHNPYLQNMILAGSLLLSPTRDPGSRHSSNGKARRPTRFTTGGQTTQQAHGCRWEGERSRLIKGPGNM